MNLKEIEDKNHDSFGSPFRIIDVDNDDKVIATGATANAAWFIAARRLEKMLNAIENSIYFHIYENEDLEYYD